MRRDSVAVLRALFLIGLLLATGCAYMPPVPTEAPVPTGPTGRFSRAEQATARALHAYEAGDTAAAATQLNSALRYLGTDPEADSVRVMIRRALLTIYCAGGRTAKAREVRDQLQGGSK
jgi:Tfp pilus assembly protein PilF